MNKTQLKQVLDAQGLIVSKIGHGQSLPDCLFTMCQCIEEILCADAIKSSILLLEDGRLNHGAAPSLPELYCRAINGAPIGPNAGSCGTAAYLAKPVVVADIESDPLWKDYAALALSHGLRACWSLPIIASNKKVLGTFALYHATPQHPRKDQIEVLQQFTDLAALAIEWSIAIEREKRLSAELSHSHKKFSAFVSVFPDLAIILDEDGYYVDVYGADQDLLYAETKKLTGKKVTDILPEMDSAPIMKVVAQTLATNTVQIFEYSLNVPKGQIIFEGRVTAIDHYLPNAPMRRHVLWLARDISDRKAAERKTEQLAFYDALTQLPNRRLLLEQLQLTINKAKRSKKMGALLFLDLDDFKQVNDHSGHAIGDSLLIDVTQRMKSVLRSSDLFSRIGGDEFIVLLDILDEDVDLICKDASNVATKLIGAVVTPFSDYPGVVKLGLSVGICTITGDEPSSNEVLIRADAAMYVSKNKGGNQYTFFDPALQRILEHRAELERGISGALRAKQFSTYFQPKVNKRREIIGFEALLRWLHPEKGVILPLEFLDIAEQFGLILDLQQIAFEDSCALLHDLVEAQFNDLIVNVSVNLCSAQFYRTTLANDLVGLLRANKLAPHHITLECTEEIVHENLHAAEKQIETLQDHGFIVSLDDFGTGALSLKHLHHLGLNEIKLDISIVQAANKKNAIGLAVVDATVALSAHLGFTVLAEGVETKTQFDRLASLGINAFQGNLIAPPMSKEDLICWLTQNCKRLSH